MKVANVSTTKNTLSSILAEVKRGETYLIVDRSVPVARIEPLHAGTEKLASLVADGVVVMPQQEDRRGALRSRFQGLLFRRARLPQPR